MAPSAPDATVVITTKNRKEDLRQAIVSALAQQGAAVEVLVVDDGSTDGTAAMVRQEFPSVRLERAEQSRGYIVQRNRGAALARGAVIFSIDDDAIFSTPRTVAQTLAEFNHPRIGAVAIPFVNVNQDPAVRQRAPGTDQIYLVDRFIGTAHAVRRELFLKLGGYREFLVHQGEEGDLGIRLLDAGYVVRLGNADPIHHFESPRRDMRRMDYYGRRNDVLFAWHNAPARWLPWHLLATTLNGAIFALKIRRPARMFGGLAVGWLQCLPQWRQRRAVKVEVYRLSRRLKKGGPLPLTAVEPLLPPMKS